MTYVVHEGADEYIEYFECVEYDENVYGLLALPKHPHDTASQFYEIILQKCLCHSKLLSPKHIG